jgi:nucleoside-diphosphate-sugar epimerase
MRVLVTGGTGYLGSHLIQALLGRGHQVVLLKRSGSRLSRLADVLPRLQVYDRERVALEEIFANQTPIDVVANLAASYGRDGEADVELVKANVQFPLAVLEAAEQAGTKLFLNTDTSLPAASGRYALAKKQFSSWGRVAAERGRVCFVNVLLEHFYGPGDDPSKFVAYLVRSLLQNVPEIPLTEGLQQRDFVYIDDVVQALCLLLEKPVCGQKTFQEYPLGSGVAVTIRSLAELLRQLSGATTRLAFGALPYRTREPMYACADISALRDLGWCPMEKLKSGLQKTLDGDRQA